MFASIPSPPPEWQIPLTIPLGFTTIQIHTYALCILAGIIVAVWWTNRRLQQRGAEPGIVLDVSDLGGAARTRRRAPVPRASRTPTTTSDPSSGQDFWAGFVHMIAIWEGGNAIFGSLIGGAIGAWIGCKFAGIRFWSFADALVPGMLSAQILGRLGNYFNQELFGLPTDLPWGLRDHRPEHADPGRTAGRHPVPPDVRVRDALEHLRHRRDPAARAPVQARSGARSWALYMIWYGLGRTWFESIRIDPCEVFLGLRSNVWAALVAILLGIILFIVQTRNHPGREPGVYLPGREWTPKGEVDSGDTYSDTDEPGDDASESEGSLSDLATSGTSKKSSKAETEGLNS